MAAVARGGVRPSHRMKKPYRAWYPTEGGKEQSECFAIEAEAQRWVDEHRAAAIDRQRELETSTEMTLAQLWRAEREAILWNLKQGSVHHYENAIERYILPKHVLDDGRSWPAMGDRQLGLIKARHCMQLVEAMKALGLATSTRRGNMAVLSKMLSIAVREDLIPGNPMRSVPMPKGEKPLIVPLTVDQMIAIRDYMPEHLQLSVMLMGLCGLRISECLGLAPSSFEMTADGTYKLHVVRGLVRVRGRSHFETPKTLNSRRHLPVPSELTDSVTSHLEDFGHPELAFHTLEGTWIEYSNFRQREWLPACAKAGVRANIHSLRHSAVCLWIDQGLTDPEIMGMAGHGSAYYLKETYGHYREAVAKQAMERVGDALRRRADDL